MADYMHNEIPDAMLHNPKGFAAADVGTFPYKNTAGALVWVPAAAHGAVINHAPVVSAPPTEVSGDRYLLVGAGSAHASWDGGVRGQIAEFNGTLWVSLPPVAGDLLVSEAGGMYRYNGTVWMADHTLRTLTAAETLDERDSVVLVNASTNFDVTLPTVASFTGQKFYIRRIDAGVNTVNIGRGGVNIDGAAADKVLGITSTTREHILTSDGTGWWSLSNG